MKKISETIAAIATPRGAGGVGIVRVSGSLAADISRDIVGVLPTPRMAHFSDFLDKNKKTLDEGLSLYFPGPHSFTGEDVLELQGHGGPIVMDMVLQRVIECGARQAKPGEFSERAFLNNKLDLTQAEAIADLIDADSEQAARCAMRSLQGEFSKKIHGLVEQLTQLRMYVEAAIDFPEEEIDFLKDSHVLSDANIIKKALQTIIASANQGVLLRDGMTVVIAGPPNAGKSSLLNALSGVDSAIVTDIAGTTRDVLCEKINIDGMPLHIVDTAGLRESDNVIEQEGIKRANAQINQADVILVMQDSTNIQAIDDSQFPTGVPTLLLMNKSDLHSEKVIGEYDILLSAKTGQGLELLKSRLKQIAGMQGSTQSDFIARRRHLDALKRAQQLVDQGMSQLGEYNAGELFAEDLRCAQRELATITGAFSADDLLGEIFSSFCIGK
jgi:tRNA modification GTPase